MCHADSVHAVRLSGRLGYVVHVSLPRKDTKPKCAASDNNAMLKARCKSSTNQHYLVIKKDGHNVDEWWVGIVVTGQINSRRNI